MWHNEEGLLVQICHGCEKEKIINIDFVKIHPTRPEPACYGLVCNACMKPIWKKRHERLKPLLHARGLTTNYKPISKRLEIHPWRRMNQKLYYERTAA
jgi:hypothetical protein